ncbi:hypothetical protein [Alkalimarinus coralli]|uniref:hypothetical protein n=1 Tax=Alkalimarinus coralli TaxID=2935863 RepID=UPI00202B343C|nr:hypothetical protein [Alkalimarinus coralli]
MTQQNVVQIKDKAPQRALDSLNRVTGLTWNSLPKSLVAGGRVINRIGQQTYALERKRA